ncbi:hypothetical protein FB451DRAFT_1248362 [Mycena latifolia]|nr:hypothetical protein FB451DRAFT_1248362 [Mycena latifolia]
MTPCMLWLSRQPLKSSNMSESKLQNGEMQICALQGSVGTAYFGLPTADCLIMPPLQTLIPPRSRSSCTPHLRACTSQAACCHHCYCLPHPRQDHPIACAGDCGTAGHLINIIAYENTIATTAQLAVKVHACLDDAAAAPSSPWWYADFRQDLDRKDHHP